ncbi:MAG: hypothetical protein GAK28_00520 [Luteibacter sp.]|uniref:hypothetical protein n=1 Tax=Luteibacter sp. TaxID=1886636 RepID=UPI00137F3B1C|nr:hypothetical protein [Luteibacter sp.]KAF1008888.1 MAG: hypothetical protein GAK28_00520 [Luteibacter sp.]
MKSLLQHRSAAISLGLMLLGSLLTRIDPFIGKFLAGIGLMALCCTGAKAGFTKLLADARNDFGKASFFLKAHSRLWRRRARHATTPGNTVRLAWQLFALFAIAVIVSPLFGLPVDGLKHATDIVGTIGIAVALVDICFMGFGVMRWSWGKSLGKWLKAAVATIVAAIALGMARQMLARLTDEDPSKFPTSLALLTVAHLPIAWATIAAIIGGIVLIPAMIRSFIRMIREKVSNAPDRYLIALCANMLRPVLLCAAALTAGMGLSSPDLRSHPAVKAIVVTLLVNSNDFWEQDTCAGTSAMAARVADNRYVVATEKDHRLSLHTVTCPETR